MTLTLLLLCLNTCIYLLHLGPYPNIALTISTISRGGAKINVSCYMIKVIFWPWHPRWKVVPACLVF